MLEAYASGDATIIELAWVYGISRQAIWVHLKRGNHTRPRHLVADEHRQDVIDLHSKGVCAREIAERVEISWTTVERILRRYHASKRSGETSENTESRKTAKPGTAKRAARSAGPQRHPWKAQFSPARVGGENP